ncbi:hypothetical protein METBIDRAFT_32802 [Metschnikowia bicuspidata var. bicuspidata NRRL YB-4993]|uniref:Uncharacterized protein n=1 Tax=Metschnikowia bicuspidata var. bicuspidata NRRL YB-4993 TaxID=869754 RepID=A0A1A0H6Z7_9ASCO|nr:hypothetical protein METBIDRAFT_32802 [Metschnikowia bicuspidata var. bicuspidata NRRL YB-4993]OBA19730.1 hypothetical protein METBIDRAFT_32802 [Metschnikowia bicuspidata var. bicuspidata NRRL YB-4993]
MFYFEPQTWKSQYGYTFGIFCKCVPIVLRRHIIWQVEARRRRTRYFRMPSERVQKPLIL